MVKNPPSIAGNSRDVVLISGWGRSPGEGNATLSSNNLPEKFHGQRNLAGNSPWGCKELDTTEQLSTHKVILGILLGF